MLTPSQNERFERDGFLAIEAFASAEACGSLRQRAIEIVAAWQPSAQRTVFTTDQQERTSNQEFLDSGSSTWCFFEPEAFDEQGALGQDKLLSINKIGHAMHDLDAVFESFSYTADLAGVAADLGLVDALAVQSMYLFKQPRIGGEVACHQDATFLFTEPQSVLGFWFAIEDATLDNGCLWVEPGGHRGRLRQRFERMPGASEDGASGAARAGDATRFAPLDDTPLPVPAPGPGPGRAAPPRPGGDGLVPIETPAGTLVVLHGLLPHWSDVNRSASSRHAYSLHCIDAAADYPASNWLQRPADVPVRRLAAVAAGAGSAAPTGVGAEASR